MGKNWIIVKNHKYSTYCLAKTDLLLPSINLEIEILIAGVL